ncbi:hypothetical protein CHARACLAT_011587 [Characodon lateralis]|uniref:Uncharacterized protein n=1 Tax=Characodon lateralis TaxID=208331 RepID=A0ABU7F3G4_9TELE|nr:hypothetical protein [Characodon lateralis]
MAIHLNWRTWLAFIREAAKNPMVSLKELRRSTAQGHRGRRIVTPRTGHQSFPGPTQRLPRQQLTPVPGRKQTKQVC